ncbi:MAG: hypothetical protein ACXWLH_01790 [Candidatus Saccharimonadales bacterium]
MKSQHSKYLVILSPSLISLTISLFISAGLMVIVGLSNAAGKGTIYNYLFGPGSSTELISSSKSTLSALNNTILGNAILNKILYFAFWMVVGLIVYIILYAFLRGTGEATEEIKEAGYANIKRDKILQDFAIKFAVRIAAVLGGIVFSIIFLKTLLPFASLSTKNATEDLLSPNGVAYILAGFLVLMLSCHIELILIRFMALKVRLFSQQEVED